MNPTAIAREIHALINSRPQTPSVEEIAAVIEGAINFEVLPVGPQFVGHEHSQARGVGSHSGPAGYRSAAIFVPLAPIVGGVRWVVASVKGDALHTLWG